MRPQWILGLALAMGSLVGAEAAEETSSFYLTTDVGANYLDSPQVKFSRDGISGIERVKSNIGYRGSVGGGYNFNPWIGAGVEASFLYNEVRAYDLRYMQVPMLGTVQFTFENRTGFVPYIGGGAGYAFTLLGVKDYDLVFAWQAAAGVQYKLSDTMSLGVGYKYLQVAPQHYKEALSGADLRVGTLQNHMLALTFKVKF